MNNNNSGFSLGYKIINPTAFNLLVRTKGGLNVILPREEKYYKSLSGDKVRLVVTIKSTDIDAIKFNVDCIKNTFDKYIVTEIEKNLQIDREVRSNYTPDFEFTLNREIEINIGEVGYNAFNGTGFRSDLFGFEILEYTNDNQITRFISGGGWGDLDDLSEEVVDNEDKETKTFITVKLIDNYNRVGDLWTMILGIPIQVKAIKSVKEEGLYFIGSLDGKIQSFIPINELTENKLKELSLFKTELDAKTLPHNKHVTELQKKLSDGKKTIEKKNEELTKKDNAYRDLQIKYDSDTNKLSGQIQNQQWDIKELNRTINDMKQENKVNDILRKYIDTTEKLNREKEIKEIKNNSGTNSILDYLKIAGSLIGIITTVYRLLT